MTRRQAYWVDLKFIWQQSGTLNRRLSFTEARTLASDIRAELSTGYSLETAVQRAYDYLFAVRIAIRKGTTYGYSL